MLTLAWMVGLGTLLQTPAGTMVVLPLVPADGVVASETDTFNAVLAQEVTHQATRPVMSWLEVPDAQREAAQGCADVPCAVRVGHALAVDDVVIGRLGRVGSQQVLSLYRVHVADGRVVGSSVTRLGLGDGTGVLDALPMAVAELVTGPRPPSVVSGIVSQPMDLESAVKLPGEGFIGFEMEAGSTGLADWGAVAYPVEGPRKNRLSWSEFYRRVGRVDLAESLEARTTTRMRLAWISSVASGLGIVAVSAAALVGLGMVLVPVALRSNPPPGVPPQYLTVGGPLWWTGMVLMGISGLAGFLIFTAGTSFPSLGLLVSAQPVGEAEARAMADDYNRTL